MLIDDRLNRLTQGRTADNNYIERGIVYDQAGNITNLSRVYGGTLIDSLAYTYNSTNQVQSIQDLSANNGAVGYKAGNYSYAYDSNGNMTTDNSKGITGITYNLLNLPQSIPTSPATTYYYDASGQKLRRVVGTNVTDYINGIEYDYVTGNTPALTFIQTEEGRALPNGSSYNFEYNLTDHLGDSRLKFDAATGIARTEQQDDYMPFGLDISVGSINSPQNFYLYNKKELQPNTNLYDYGARFYDPVIARWTSMDRFAEKYDALTPYQYAALNPVSIVDMNGDSLKIFYNKEMITYENGKLYGADGKEYSGKGMKVSKNGKVSYRGFLGQAKAALDKIGSQQDGNTLLSKIESNKSTAYIQEITNYNGDNSNGTKGRLISWDPGSSNSGQDETGNIIRDPFIGLAHELGHEWDIMQRTIDYSTWFAQSDGKVVTNAEKYATLWENKIRAENGLALREYYGSDQGKNIGHILIPLNIFNGGISTVNNINIGPIAIPYFYSKK